MKKIIIVTLGLYISLGIFGQTNCNTEALKSFLTAFGKGRFLKDFEISLNNKGQEMRYSMVLSANTIYSCEVILDERSGGDFSFGLEGEKKQKGAPISKFQLVEMLGYTPGLKALKGKYKFEFTPEETGIYHLIATQTQGKSVCGIAVLYFIRQNEMPAAYKFTEDSVFTKVDVMAEFPGGYQNLNDLILAEMKQKGLVSIKSGAIILEFIISDNGVPRTVNIIDSPGKEYETIVRKIIKSKTWTPALVRGKPVKQCINLRLLLE